MPYDGWTWMFDGPSISLTLEKIHYFFYWPIYGGLHGNGLFETVSSRRDSIWPNSVINNIYCFADFGQFYQNQVEQL